MRCGRGKGSLNNPGNQRYRQWIQDQSTAYHCASSLEKVSIVREFILKWRAQEPPGRFLRQTDGTGLWEDVGDAKAVEKTAQAFREKKAPQQLRQGQLDEEQHLDKTRDGGKSNLAENKDHILKRELGNKPERNVMITGEVRATHRRDGGWQLHDIQTPCENDVLCGRGCAINRHPGNQRFRAMVAQRRPVLFGTKLRERGSVAVEFVREWRAQEPPGRFLRQNDGTGLWEDIGDAKAVGKTAQAFREKKAPQQLRQGQLDEEQCLDKTTDGGPSNLAENMDHGLKREGRERHVGSHAPPIIDVSVPRLPGGAFGFFVKPNANGDTCVSSSHKQPLVQFGDKVLFVNGESTSGKSFDEVIGIVRDTPRGEKLQLKLQRFCAMKVEDLPDNAGLGEDSCLGSKRKKTRVK